MRATSSWTWAAGAASRGGCATPTPACRCPRRCRATRCRRCKNAGLIGDPLYRCATCMARKATHAQQIAQRNRYAHVDRSPFTLWSRSLKSAAVAGLLSTSRMSRQIMVDDVVDVACNGVPLELVRRPLSLMTELEVPFLLLLHSVIGGKSHVCFLRHSHSIAAWLVRCCVCCLVRSWVCVGVTAPRFRQCSSERCGNDRNG